MSRDRFAKRQKTAMLKDKRLNTIRRIIFVLIPLSLLLCPSCDPEAKWTTKDVVIDMNMQTVSAGFIECSFSTNKEAYYLIACQEVDEGLDPVKMPKQFMTLALDSAYAEYLNWRQRLLKEGEFNIAPFASHALQYGEVNHYFTGLWFETEYWIYAFVVDPVAMKPVGPLYLQTVKTEYESIVPLGFDYRVKGNWDYIYPMDSASRSINTHFPYVTTTRDSAELMQEIAQTDSTGLMISPQQYFLLWLLSQSAYPEQAHPLYGVNVRENDGIFDGIEFEEGHTYYTFIGGFDFSMRQNTLYKFQWVGDTTNLYFSREDSIALEDLEIETEE